MVLNKQTYPHLIGSYNSEKNIYVLFDRKIASSLITMFYHKPIEVYKNKFQDSNYTIILDKNNIDSKKIQTHILIRNPISRIKSYIIERTFKQLHHVIHSEEEYKDGYDENIFTNKDTLVLFNNLKNSVFLNKGKYYLDMDKIKLSDLDKFIDYIINSVIDFIDAKNSPTLNNNYHKKIYEFIQNNNVNIIDTSHLSKYFNILGINPKSKKFKISELHRNHHWSEMIKVMYPYLKKHKKYNVIEKFIENEIYFYRKILKENQLFSNNTIIKNLI